MRTPASRRAAILAVALSSPALAQGTTNYLNFEAPSHKPIACTTAGSGAFLLVCNAPDNCVEVYSTANINSPTFIRRVHVGLEPVTVAVKPTILSGNVRRCYTANWLGDSITVFDLTAAGAVNVVGTFHVGDEPIGIAFRPGDESLLVTFSAQASWGWFNNTTLQPFQAGSNLLELRDVSGTRAIKDPRAIAFSPSTSAAPNIPDQLCILNHRGGSDPAAFDYDLWSSSNVLNSANAQQASLPDLGGIGSTNFNMAFAPNGDLYVVSQHARNKGLANFITDLGEPAMQSFVTTSTGFVTSQLIRIRGIGSAAPTIDPPLDLNSTTGYQGTQAALAITQPTDVVVRGTGGVGTQIYVTGFNSDTLGVVTTTVGGITLTRIDVGNLANRFSTTNYNGVMRGPRGLALNAAQSRLYVYNRIDASVTVVDTTTATPTVVGNFALQRDPTPPYIRDNRKFLYSSALSGGGNASCASCHIDATSDFLAWNLSDGVHVPPSPNPTVGGDPRGFLGENGLQTSINFDDRKGPMQTQSLRGLVNFEVANDTVQDNLFSNKPYHWRGDRATFQDFNGAFINLLAIPNQFSSTQGIPPAEMTKYREFINSVHYPPNPEQPINRVHSGSMTTPNPNGSPNPLDDPAAGAGALWGLKNFHIMNTDGNSCVHCHSLPEGSNNRFTEAARWVGTDLDAHNIETAALRALVSKEAELWRFNPGTGNVEPKFAVGGTIPVKTGEFGLIHTGLTTTQFTNIGSRSIVDFCKGFPLSTAQLNAMVRYMREFDSGVAPIIGRAVTMSMGAAVPADLVEMETQVARCNAGLSVYARLNGVLRGFWFDPSQFATTPYVEQPQTGLAAIGPFNRAQLLAQMVFARDVMVFQSTPLGSARRIAYLGSGPVAMPVPSAPTAITLRGCRAADHNVGIPTLTRLWLDQWIVTNFTSASTTTNIGNNQSMIHYQGSLKTHAASATPAGFGLADFRHEPPRRFVVRGNAIKDTAWLRIFVPNATDWATATTTTPPTTTPTTTTHPRPIELPLYAAIERGTGILEWQTAVELEPYHLLALMNGGPNSAEVLTAMNDPAQLQALNPPIFSTSGGATADFFQPLLRNWYYIQVINDPNVPSSTSAGVWQRITLQ